MKALLPSFALRLIVVLLWVSLLVGGVGIRPAYAADYTVNSLSDNTFDDSSCTLREAILAANNASGYNGDCGSSSTGDDTITFSVNGTITLSSSLPNIVSGAGTLTIDGGGNITISGNNSVAVMVVNPSAELSLQNLTITNGKTSGSGGGVFNNAGTLNITNSTFSNNKASVYGGGVYNYNGILEIVHSTFSGNIASGVSYSGGGGVYNFGGTVTIANSTFANNSATGSSGGGGVSNSDNGTLIITNSTFSGNSANASNSGGGVRIWSGSVTLKNTLIANSTNGDCVGAVSSANNNLIESTGGNACNLTHNTNGNIIGQDPNLGALSGSPAYFPLNPGSPAINAGDNATCAAAPVNNQSQNGVTRPQGTSCDIGSYEAYLLFLPLVIRQ